MGSRRLKIELRPAEWEDCEILHGWAMDPVTRQMSFNTNPIPFEQHQRWFAERLRDPRCRFYILLTDHGDRAGQLRFQLEEDGIAEVSFSLAPEKRGLGLASVALLSGVARLEETRDASRVVAHIKPENIASLRAFESAGFGHHRLLERRGERVIRLERSVVGNVFGRMGRQSRTALAQRLDRWRAELRGEGLVERARALVELARHRRSGKALSPEQRAEAYRAFVQRHPSYFRARSFLGHALLAAREPEEAARVFESALPLAPFDPGVLEGLRVSTHALGWSPPRPVIAFLERQPDIGYRTLEEALRLARDAGETEEAERIARRLVRLFPLGPNPEEAELSRLRTRALNLLEGSPIQRPAAWLLDGQRRRLRPPKATSRDEPAPGRPRLIEPVDVVDVLDRIEAELPVHEWRVNEVTVWPILRNQIGAVLVSLMQDVAPAQAKPVPKLTAVKGFGRSLLQAFRDQHGHLSALSRADVLFVGLTSHRQLLRGLWYDRLFDPLRDLLDARGLSSLQLETHWNVLPASAPRPRPSIPLQPFIDELLLSAPKLPVWGSSLPGWEGLSGLLAPYREALGSPLWLEPQPERWAQWMTSIFKAADYFDFVLEKVRPRVVFLTVYYSVFGYALCLAAARRGIPTVDVQHGMTTRHYAYESWSKLPPSGYPMMPSTFWTWTDRDANRISSWSASHARYHRPIVGGHPWMVHADRPDQRDEAARERLRGMRGARLTVLITLNWSFGFAEIFREVLRSAELDTSWWVRLHPSMRPQLEEITRWCKEHVRAPHEVETVTNVPLGAVLEACDVHLTLSSSVTQEATRAGVPTVCVEARSQWLYAEEIASGWVQCVPERPEAILRALDEQAARAKTLARWAPFPGPDRMASALAELVGTTNRPG